MSGRGRFAAPVPLWALSLPVLTLAGPLSAQQEALVTDRPDFTESARSVSPGQIQAEAGYTLTRAAGDHAHALGELLLRVGLPGGLEARFGTGSYVWSSGEEGHFSEPSLGLKAELPAGGVADEVALLVGAAAGPWRSADRQESWSPEARLALAWEPGGVSLSGNAGWSRVRSPEASFDQALASLAAGFALGGSWSAYLESYAYSREQPGGDATAWLNGGATLLLSPDAQLDGRIGARVRGERELFLGLGLALRR